ncbi:rhodanese-like domain-containing protein [Thalassobacillus devorans]|uniref:Rhodanese-like domain-containing protein n=1 Tax=Thalassobacillus devorans TaxID=279813 RepID=A0ABQ1NND5_9BACI|nr:rhodanese-like domain-containing protein [Thalassobacillus devorans]NIK27651.1 rhodanese-related sulfurtransferase [Thalassobacillus devorans]GGC79440.1 rhodanese-like domain-containing protein [Thalassobacillus devorans]
MKSLTAEQVKEIMEQGEQLNIVDVREVGEVSQGKVPGAVNIPLHLLEFRKDELDKNKNYIMVCRSGGRSGQATQFLDQYGYDVTNMEGGMMSWTGKVE